MLSTGNIFFHVIDDSIRVMHSCKQLDIKLLYELSRADYYIELKLIEIEF